MITVYNTTWKRLNLAKYSKKKTTISSYSLFNFFLLHN